MTYVGRVENVTHLETEEPDQPFEDFGDVDGLTPTTEPKLTQLDESSRKIILDSIYEVVYMKDPETGVLVRDSETEIPLRVKRVIYPEIEKAFAYAASHLNSVMNYTWAHGQAAILFYEGLFHDPLRLYYEDDPNALRLLDAIYSIFWRGVIGGSIGGTHQNYNVRMSGAHRTFEVKRNE